MSTSGALEISEPRILPVVLRAVAAVILASILFLTLGMTVVGWKICCTLETDEFTERNDAIESVVDGMGPVWPFQSIEMGTNNAGDILIQRNWLGVVELQATLNNADHEREVAENNQLEPSFDSDTEWVFHKDYERGAGVTLKSGLMAVAVVSVVFLALRFTQRRP